LFFQSAFADFLMSSVLTKLIMGDPAFLASIIRDAVIEMIILRGPANSARS